MILLYFGPFGGIFGPSTQLPRPVPSERMVRLGRFSNNKRFLTSWSLLWAIKSVGVQWLFTDKYSADWF